MDTLTLTTSATRALTSDERTTVRQSMTITEIRFVDVGRRRGAMPLTRSRRQHHLAPRDSLADRVRRRVAEQPDDIQMSDDLVDAIADLLASV